MCKAISAINETIYMASNKETETLKLGKKKWTRPLEIVLNGFVKEDLPGRNKLPVEVYIP